MEIKNCANSISYQIVEFLGEGLNSCVYRAIKENKEFGMSQSLAIKILKSEKLVSIWRNEISRMSALRSKYCVGYFGWDIISSKPALVLEYIKGLTLEELIAEARLEKAELDEVLAQSLQGLKDLQDAGLFHGDLNTHNIMIDDTGTVKLVDFGIYDKSGAVFTTPKYAAPQILSGTLPNFETDAYSLKVIGAELAKKSRISVPIEMHEIRLSEISRQKLASKVCRILDKKSVRQGFTQKLAQITKKNWNINRFIQAGTMALLFCLPLFSRGDSEITVTKVAYTLSVRTNNWLKIKINGQSLGYAPVDLTLVGRDKVTIEWHSESGQGRTVLTPKSEQHIVLKDDFFSNQNTQDGYNDGRTHEVNE